MIEELLDIVENRYKKNNISLTAKAKDAIYFALLGEFQRSGIDAATRCAKEGKLLGENDLRAIG